MQNNLIDQNYPKETQNDNKKKRFEKETQNNSWTKKQVSIDVTVNTRTCKITFRCLVLSVFIKRDKLRQN